VRCTLSPAQAARYRSEAHREAPSSQHRRLLPRAVTALGGTSYAAIKLPANSVGSRELKPRSVQTTDLATDARLSKTNKVFRSAVTDVVLDPNTQSVVNALADAVKGEKGDTGPAGSTGAQGAIGAPGASGAQGASGEKGVPGQAFGYAHVEQNGVILDESLNTEVTRAQGYSVYCVKSATGTVKNITVTLDANDSLDATAFARKPNSVSPCLGYPFEVIIAASSGTAIDHAFYVALN
jgi:hypothetical protein